jgi:hypothetical protein
VLEEPQLVLLQRLLVVQRAVLLGHLGLRLQLLEVRVEFAQDVVDARQVLARVLQPIFGLAAALLVLGDAGSFLEEQPQLLGLALDDAADRALADDRVGARPEAGAEENVLHVAPPHGLVVDVVARRAVARQHALDCDLGEAVPLAARARVFIAEHQLDAGAAGRLALARAVEDHVLHRLAAQLAGLALAEHPAHGVDDIGLAAAVGADDADTLAGQLKRSGFGERFEARELDLVQAHESKRVGPGWTNGSPVCRRSMNARCVVALDTRGCRKRADDSIAPHRFPSSDGPFPQPRRRSTRAHQTRRPAQRTEQGAAGVRQPGAAA